MDWKPTRDLEIVAGTPPGGGLDRTARAVAEIIEKYRLANVRVQVKNVPGDGARKAWEYMDTLRGNPHVVSISHGNMTTDYLLGARSSDHRAYTPVAMLYTEYIAFVARSDSALRTTADLLRDSRDAASLTVAVSTSRGNPNHIAAAKVVRHAGGDPRALTVRVFDSALDAVDDVIAGQSDVAAVTAASVLKALREGNARVLAVSAPQRLSGAFADAPTWREQGVDCMIGAWRGISGAAGIGAAHVAYWERLLGAVRNTTEWSAALEKRGWTDSYMTGTALARYLASEHEEMAAGLSALGLMNRKGNRS